MADPDRRCHRRLCVSQACALAAVVIVDAPMTFLDGQTDEHAMDTLDRMAGIPDQLKPIVAMGCMHAGLAIIAQSLGHGRIQGSQSIAFLRIC